MFDTKLHTKYMYIYSFFVLEILLKVRYLNTFPTKPGTQEKAKQ
jgi:hypothetical protein